MRPAIVEGLLQGAGHPGVGLRDPELCHHLAEPVAVLGQIDRLGRGPQDLDPGLLQLPGNVERRLPPELHDDPHGLLFLVDAQDILHGKGLEIELVRGVVVGGDRLRVAVHHDRLVSEVADRKGHVHTAVVELDALSDTVRAAPQDHDLLPVTDLHLVRGVVRGVVIGRILHAAYRHGLPCLDHVQGDALFPDVALLRTEEPGKVPVRKAVLLGR